MWSRVNISAGEFFELVRPTVIIVSALVATWVLVSARKRFSLLSSLLWSLGVFLLPAIVLPIYWATILVRKSVRVLHHDRRWSVAFPTLYAIVLLTGSVLYLREQSHGADAHLFRASQAKVNGNPAQAIAEYRKALALEENPHTHKLLAIELYKSRELEPALKEFRLAESEGEQDEWLAYSIGSLLIEMGQTAEARTEYHRLVSGAACSREPNDQRCRTAKLGLNSPSP